MSSNVSAGLAYARVDSSTDLMMHVRPDIYFPPEVVFPPQPPIPTSHLHRLNAELKANREFEGAGPSIAWDGSVVLWGDAEESGRLGLDIGVSGAVLFGKQEAHVREHRLGAYTGGIFFGDWDANDITAPYDTTLEHSRSERVTVPTASANLGLSYELGRVKMTGGYRVERYFDVIDAGIAERKTYDRQFDGPYFKVSVGFGG